MTVFHFNDKLLRRTASPCCALRNFSVVEGENKSEEFHHGNPPPNPRQRGTSSESASIIFFEQKQSEYNLCTKFTN